MSHDYVDVEQIKRERGKAKGSNANGAKAGALSPIDFSDLNTPRREWTVEDRFPRRQVGILSGEGGTGKSVILTQLAIAHVLGRDWMRSIPLQGPAMILNAEDEADEIKRRVKPILDFYDAAPQEIVGRLHVFSLVNTDPLLAVADRSGVLLPTPLYQRFYEMAGDLKPVSIGIDNIADVFGADEIDRAQVRQFIALMRRLAIVANGTVILSAHPSLTGLSTKSGLSGSTQWHNSVRFRCWLRKPAANGAEADPSLRELDFMKNNYGPLAETVPLRWENGLYRVVPRKNLIENIAANKAANETFMALLERFERNGRAVSDKQTSNNYAPTIFAKEPEAKAAHLDKQALSEAMTRLFGAEDIKVVTYGPPSNLHSRIIKGRLI